MLHICGAQKRRQRDGIRNQYSLRHSCGQCLVSPLHALADVMTVVGGVSKIQDSGLSGSMQGTDFFRLYTSRSTSLLRQVGGAVYLQSSWWWGELQTIENPSMWLSWMKRKGLDSGEPGKYLSRSDPFRPYSGCMGRPPECKTNQLYNPPSCLVVALLTDIYLYSFSRDGVGASVRHRDNPPPPPYIDRR